MTFLAAFAAEAGRNGVASFEPRCRQMRPLPNHESERRVGCPERRDRYLMMHVLNRWVNNLDRIETNLERTR